MESLITQIEGINRMAHDVMEGLLHAEQSGQIYTKEYAIMSRQYSLLIWTRNALRRLVRKANRLQNDVSVPDIKELETEHEESEPCEPLKIRDTGKIFQALKDLGEDSKNVEIAMSKDGKFAVVNIDDSFFGRWSFDTEEFCEME